MVVFFLQHKFHFNKQIFLLVSEKTYRTKLNLFCSGSCLNCYTVLTRSPEGVSLENGLSAGPLMPKI